MICVFEKTKLFLIRCYKLFISLQCRGAELPIIESLDPVDRDVVFIPTRLPYDPRYLLAGRESPSKN